MKVLVNGGLNLSELDGWWAGAYTPQVGWSIGDGREHDNDPQWDAEEAEGLYTLLENEIVPMFYARAENGIPEDWMRRVRESMATLTPQFSSERMVRQYVEELYAPAAAAYRTRLADHCRVGSDVQGWRDMIANYWSDLSFGALHVEPAGAGHDFRVLVSLGAIGPGAVQVQLYAPAWEHGATERIPMQRGDEVIRGTFSYHVHVEGPRPPEVYTPRIVPYHPDASFPLEAEKISWYAR
jgi:glycogen phosphorylase